MSDRTLKVGQCACDMGGIHIMEYEAFPQRSPTLQIPVAPGEKIELRIDGLDKEVFLERGRDGSVSVHVDDIDMLIEKLKLAKKLLGS